MYRYENGNINLNHCTHSLTLTCVMNLSLKTHHHYCEQHCCWDRGKFKELYDKVDSLISSIVWISMFMPEIIQPLLIKLRCLKHLLYSVYQILTVNMTNVYSDSSVHTTVPYSPVELPLCFFLSNTTDCYNSLSWLIAFRSTVCYEGWSETNNKTCSSEGSI